MWRSAHVRAGLAITPLECHPVATLKIQDGRRLLHAVFDPSSGGAAWPTSTPSHSKEADCGLCGTAQAGLSGRERHIVL